jgi:CTD small phosphatase-like protein 2
VVGAWRSSARAPRLIVPPLTPLAPTPLHLYAEEEKAEAEAAAAAAGGSLTSLHAPDVAVPVLAQAPAGRSSSSSSSSAAASASSVTSMSSLAARTAASLTLYADENVPASALTQLASPGAGAGAMPPRHTGAATAAQQHHQQQQAALAAAHAHAQQQQAAAAAAAASAAAASAAAAAAEAAAAAAAGASAAAEEEDEYDVEYEEFNPYLFIKLLPPYHAVAPKSPRIALPKKLKKMPDVNLVLDLDETLVHCSVDYIPDADVTFPVAFNGMNYMVYVRKRPFLDKFFASIHGKFEVTIFTASQQVYAERLLNLLDPEGIHIHHRLYRDSCLNVDGNYLKDLNVLGRDLSKTVLVDNSPHAFGYQLDNGIPIESWFDDRGDTELLKLSAFLHQLIGQTDVRPVVRDKFRVHKLVDESK